MEGYVCIVQENQPPARLQAELAEGLTRIGCELLGDPPEGVQIRWMKVSGGFGFTAGAPSRASLVARSVPAGYPDAERETFLTRVCDLWTEVTGCTTNDIVVTAIDGPLPL